LYLSAVRYDPQLQLPAGCALTLPALPVLPEMAEHPDSISPQDPR